MVWSMMKRKVRDMAKSTSKISEIIEFGNKALSEISEEQILNCVSHTKKVIDWFWEKEGLTGAIPPFIIELDDDEEEWEEESEDDVDDCEINVWD